jgi:DNA-binding response OmpR family regulator
LPKILIVDDDRTTVKLLQTLLEMDGFDVIVAARGQTALELAHETQPDIFLVDYHLADMDGIELVADLRADSVFADAPIVVASGLNVEDAALNAGADKFLVKPFEPNKLADLFYGLLG